MVFGVIKRAAALGLDLLSYDMVVHMGLGVYDCKDTMLMTND